MSSMTPTWVFSSRYAVWTSKSCGHRARQVVLFSLSKVYSTFTGGCQQRQPRIEDKKKRTPHRADGYTVLSLHVRDVPCLLPCTAGRTCKIVEGAFEDERCGELKEIVMKHAQVRLICKERYASTSPARRRMEHLQCRRLAIGGDDAAIGRDRVRKVKPAAAEE